MELGTDADQFPTQRFQQRRQYSVTIAVIQRRITLAVGWRQWPPGRVVVGRHDLVPFWLRLIRRCRARIGWPGPAKREAPSESLRAVLPATDGRRGGTRSRSRSISQHPDGHS